MIELQLEYWERGDIKRSGQEYGNLQKLFLNQSFKDEFLGRPVIERPETQFVAGWYHAVTVIEQFRTNETRKEIEDAIGSCYRVDYILKDGLLNAMDYYKAGDAYNGDIMMSDSKQRWNYALQGCGDIATNSSQILERLKELRN